ncbi:MAG TPA: endonuclease/exonuclease/phosphatase family protein [Candidatus Limnocylindrales bacterium]
MSQTAMDFDEVDRLLTALRQATSVLEQGGETFSSNTSGNSWLPDIFEPGSKMFGNTPEGERCRDAYVEDRSTMKALMGAFATTADADAERLEFAIHLFRTEDNDAADRMLRAGRDELNVFSTHIDKDDDDARQGEEIDRVGRIVDDPAGANTVLAGDFNTEHGNEDEQGDQAINRLEEDRGFDVDAGRLNDGEGGTSSGGNHIDYIMGRGVGSTDAERWDRERSDHDGMTTDVTVTDW